MSNYEKLIEIQKRKLKKALQHLQYSYNKIIKLPENVEELDEESLETWESFAARFACVAEIFLAQYLRSAILLDDPGFTGTFRDFINQAEKLGLIVDANAWLAIRELRNVTAHEYSEEDLTLFFKRLKQECPRLLKILVD
jgi:hypothetical protein